jgi:hypothetical protein
MAETGETGKPGSHWFGTYQLVTYHENIVKALTEDPDLLDKFAVMSQNYTIGDGVPFCVLCGANWSATLGPCQPTGSMKTVVTLVRDGEDLAAGIQVTESG